VSGRTEIPDKPPLWISKTPTLHITLSEPLQNYMAPAAAEAMSTPSSSQIKSENKKSDKVIEELLSKLSISKAQDEINSTSLDLATFVNGDIEQGDAPTK